MILNLISGGGGETGTAGAILQVNAPAGVTVTAAREETVFTQSVNDQGIAVLEGLTTGAWEVTITDGDRTSKPTVVNITTDYSCIVSFFQATISVTYPEGAACTCYKDTVLFTAPDQSGSAVFTIPEDGTWVVSCTDPTGEFTNEKTVEITTNGQSAAVTVKQDAYLFNASPINNDLTGGWDGVAIKRDSIVNATPMKPVVTQYQDHATLTYASGGTTKSGMYKTVKKIDLTDVQSIEFTGILKTISTTDVATRACLSCWSEIGSYWNLNVTARMGVEVGNGVYGTYKLDVSNLSGSHYVGFNLHSTYSDISIYKLILRYGP